MGHLCDSATNNQHRFIKIQLEKQPFVVIPYDQNKWIWVQNYQGIPTEEVVDLWATLNKHLVRVIAGIPEEKLGYQCDLGNHKIFTLSELVQDYLRHLDHHLVQIFGTTDI